MLLPARISPSLLIFPKSVEFLKCLIGFAVGAVQGVSTTLLMAYLVICPVQYVYAIPYEQRGADYSGPQPSEEQRSEQGGGDDILTEVSHPPSVPMPKQASNGSVLGSSEEYFSESGDGRYGISIPLPAGVSGLTPSLSLGYSSSSSVTSVVGKGWALGGLYKIERTSSGGGLPQYGQNGDVFVIDSPVASGELVCLNAVLQEDKWVCQGDYDTLSRSFAKVKRKNSGGNNYWEVTGQDGTLYTFGGTTSTIYGSGPGSTTFEQTHTWFLREIRDLNGNTIVYNWDNLTGHPSLASISYGGRKVLFRYEAFSEAQPRFISYARAGVDNLTQFLKKIYIVYNNKTLGGVELTYNEAGKSPNPATEKYLTKVQFFGPAASAPVESNLTDTSVSPPYAPQKYQFSYTQQAIGSGVGGAWEQFSTGFNIPLTFAANGAETNFRVGDVNGDGREDLILAEKVYGPSGSQPMANWGVHLGTANGWSSTAVATSAGDMPFGFGFQGHPGLSTGAVVGDFNGDGCQDVQEAYSDYLDAGIVYHAVSFSNCGTLNDPLKFTQVVLTSGPRILDLASSPARAIDYGVRATDLNMDGQTDLFKLCNDKFFYSPDPADRCGDSGAYISTSQGRTFVNYGDVSSPLQGVPFPIGWQQADTFNVSFSDHYPAFTIVDGSNIFYYPASSGSSGDQLVDFNNDGLSDLYAPSDSRYVGSYVQPNSWIGW